LGSGLKKRHGSKREKWVGIFKKIEHDYKAQENGESRSGGDFEIIFFAKKMKFFGFFRK
jgi:hypothetical protein